MGSPERIGNDLWNQSQLLNHFTKGWLHESTSQDSLELLELKYFGLGCLQEEWTTHSSEEEFSKVLVRPSKNDNTRKGVWFQAQSALLYCYHSCKDNLTQAHSPAHYFLVKALRSSTCLMKSNYCSLALEILLRKTLDERQATSPLDLTREVCQVPPVPITSIHPDSPLLELAQICLVLNFVIPFFCI